MICSWRYSLISVVGAKQMMFATEMSLLALFGAMLLRQRVDAQADVRNIYI